jgi:RNA 2',3'-cyclic 3'-phosphodiesterase
MIDSLHNSCLFCGIIERGGATLRTFLCIPLQANVKDNISSIASKLQEQIKTRASWVQPQNYHITVRFLGEIDPMLTLSLKDACQDVTSQIPSFKTKFDELGAFPSLDRPRVIWVGGKLPEHFRELLTLLDKKLSELGFTHAHQETMAHITLARIKGRVNTSLHQVTKKAKKPDWVVQADSLVLMESQLTRKGPLYSPLFTLPLVHRGPKTGGNNQYAI